MSSVEPAVAVLNLLYTNWSITVPAKDNNAAATQNPAKVHFTNRWFAPVPLRIHTFQISVRPLTKPYRPLQIGSISGYINREVLVVHVWVLPNPQLSGQINPTSGANPQQSIEVAYDALKLMMVELRRIIRVLGETAGSGIQHILLGPWQDRSELDQEVPRLHVEARLEAILFEAGFPTGFGFPTLLADIGAADQNSSG